MTENRAIAACGVGAAVFAAVSLLCFGLAIGFDPLAGAELVERVVETKPDDASWIRWGAIADTLGYYLLPMIVMVLLRVRLSWRSPVAEVASVGGLVYGTLGLAGAAILAAAAPPLIEEGSGDLATVVRIVVGLWQWGEPLPFALWSLGVASTLRRDGSAFFPLLAALPVGAALVLVGRLFEVDVVTAAGLALWLGLFPVAMATVHRWSESPSAATAS